MKQLFTLVALSLQCVVAFGQTINVHRIGGSVVNYPSDDVEYIDFTLAPEPTPIEGTYCSDANHPHAIDLGLPSGTKWACCNVGANTIEEYGGHYSWGETEEKSVYMESNYLYFTGSSYVNIGMDIAGTSYDVAHVKWGDNWHIPSLEQIVELTNNTTSEWVIVNGVFGRIFTSKINNETIFLPAAGCIWEDDFQYSGLYGRYWSSSRDAHGSGISYYLTLDSSGWDWGYFSRRYGGLSVRAVCP